MKESHFGFSIGNDTCDECIYETIIKDIPEYKFEPWGNKPIWAKYKEKSKTKRCLIYFGDYENASICTKHLKGLFG
jgi:hypothetical protein